MADENGRILFYRDGAVTHARLSGPVTAASVLVFQQTLESAIAPDCTVLILDLGAADYLESDGVRWLQRLQSDLEARSVELRLAVREGSRAERTLMLLQLHRTLRIEVYPAESPGRPLSVH
jgi:anti-anti-sigma regulatory factor